jgi:exopolysaccharide biosynthesis polyprenyl glycosylphosphotransferase
MKFVNLPSIVGLSAVAALPVEHANYVTAILLMTVLTFVVRSVAAGVRRKKVLARRIVILGSGPIASRLIEEIETAGKPRYVVAGLVAPRPPKEPAAAHRWLGRFDELGAIVERVRPSRIVVALDDRRNHLPLKPLLESRIRGVVVEDALEFYERLTGKMAIEALTPGTLILSNGFRNHGVHEIAGRVVSLVCAAIGMLLALPLLAAIALAIKIDSRGPVMFVQDRAGRDGRPFRLLKFRTMHPSDERRSEWVHDNEARITRLGRWLRRFRFDELPQLLNVLRGDMNLIGPRPHPTVNQQLFVEQIAYYGLRSTILPGVTGWAQIRYGYANNLDEETEKMRYDLYYIKNRSIWLDFRILVETIGTVLFGGGASSVRQVRREAWPSGTKRSSGAGYMPWLVGSRPVRSSAGRQ